MNKNHGFSLLSTLIALLVFTFGMLSLASGYLKVNTNLGENEYFTSAGVLAESLHSMLSTSPYLLTQMQGFSTANSLTNSPLLNAWKTELTTALPKGRATATATNAGATCTALLPCTVTLTIQWQKKLAHAQVFVLQVGFK
jgi:Tfp pilus assembly protein PilV